MRRKHSQNNEFGRKPRLCGGRVLSLDEPVSVAIGILDGGEDDEGEEGDDARLMYRQFPESALFMEIFNR